MLEYRNRMFKYGDRVIDMRDGSRCTVWKVSILNGLRIKHGSGLVLNNQDPKHFKLMDIPESLDLNNVVSEYKYMFVVENPSKREDLDYLSEWEADFKIFLSAKLWKGQFYLYTNEEKSEVEKWLVVI